MDITEKVRDKFNRDMTTTALRVSIVVWAIFIIIVSLFIDNKWILAGILAYEVLP